MTAERTMRAAIFDMDGVLIDSEPLWERTDEALIRLHGGSGALSEVKMKIMGLREREAVTIIKETFHLTGSVDEIMKDRQRLLLEIYRQELVAREGARELLALVRARGLKTALATSTGYAIIPTVLEKTGLQPLFDVIVSGVDVAASKPAPDIFLKAAEKLGISPDGCIVFEDAPAGVAAARAAGMRCIGVLHSRNSKEALAGADAIVASLADVTLAMLGLDSAG